MFEGLFSPRPLVFTSPLSPEEIGGLLLAHLRPPRGLLEKALPPRGSLIYEGRVAGEGGFWMMRVARRRFFMPLVRGRVTRGMDAGAEPGSKRAGTGSRVTLRIAFAPPARLAVYAYFLFALYMGVQGVMAMTAAPQQGGAPPDWGALGVPAFLLMAGGAIFVTPFLTEKALAIKALRLLLQIERVKRFDASRQAI
ncbi:MAG: hypothetical protein GC185_07855 [Alphaproteobacteria bacterium]|nr:hypothetical protein [Alphaproteobacteria bacterium]